jgi:hypothetical protein
MKIAEFKQYDTRGLGTEVINESSGEKEEKIGYMPVPPQTRLKNFCKPKPKHLLSKLDRTTDPPIFPPKTDDFQKPVKFVSEGGG